MAPPKNSSDPNAPESADDSAMPMNKTAPTDKQIKTCKKVAKKVARKDKIYNFFHPKNKRNSTITNMPPPQDSTTNMSDLPFWSLLAQLANQVMFAY